MLAKIFLLYVEGNFEDTSHSGAATSGYFVQEIFENVLLCMFSVSMVTGYSFGEIRSGLSMCD